MELIVGDMVKSNIGIFEIIKVHLPYGDETQTKYDIRDVNTKDVFLDVYLDEKWTKFN